jgi:ADP-heptose:LPS heptosyltransferase
LKYALKIPCSFVLVQRFLIIRFSSIGDIVLTSPIVRCLAAKYPEAEIHYLSKPAFRGILESNPHISKVWMWNEDSKELINELRSMQFDYIIDLHHNLRSFLVKSKLNRKSASFNKLNIEKYLYVNFRIGKLPDVHIVDRYFATLEKLGVVNDNKGLDFFIQEKDLVIINDLLPASHQNGYVALVIGALKSTKRLPFEKLLELCEKLQFPLVLLGGESEKNDGAMLSEKLGPRVLNMCGKLTLGQSASLVKQAMVVVTHDTGLMHIAAAFQKPIVSIWGNTIPAFGMYPYMPSAKSLQFFAEVKELSCRPCSKIGYSACPKKHFSCMQNQDLEKIAEEVQRMFALT